MEKADYNFLIEDWTLAQWSGAAPGIHTGRFEVRL